jgi:hypothetical protein
MRDTHNKACFGLHGMRDMCSKARLTLHVIRDTHSKMRLTLHEIRDAHREDRLILHACTQNLHPMCFNFLKSDLARSPFQFSYPTRSSKLPSPSPSLLSLFSFPVTGVIQEVGISGK